MLWTRCSMQAGFPISYPESLGAWYCRQKNAVFNIKAHNLPHQVGFQSTSVSVRCSPVVPLSGPSMEAHGCRTLMTGLNFMPFARVTCTLSPGTRSVPFFVPGAWIDLKWPLCQLGMLPKSSTFSNRERVLRVCPFVVLSPPRALALAMRQSRRRQARRVRP